MKWQIEGAAPESFLHSLPQYSPRLMQLLWNRGVKEAGEIEAFLDPQWERDVHDPFLFVDMRKAVDRIARAIKDRHKVVIHGDYDTDGVCSAIIMHKILGALGLRADVFLPHREKDGYGLNPRTVGRFIQEHYDVVICTDCASSNAQEIATLQDAGIDVIVADHHSQPPTLPDAYAVLNPQFERDTYPFKGLAAVGVAFKCAQALASSVKNDLPKGFEKWYLDFVAVATITDLAPLTGENRALVKYGLSVLNKTKWPGLRLLVKAAGLDMGALNEWNVAFQIGPRVNAAGRVDHASVAYKLLQSENEQEASQWAAQLNDTNSSRQELTDTIVRDALAQVEPQVREGRMVLMAHGTWPAGVVGLVASRITERYYRPSIVVGMSEGKSVGSGRSIPSFSIIGAVEESSRYLERYGGHHQACGFTVKSEDQIEHFWHALDAIAHKKLSDGDLEKVVRVDMELPLLDVNKETAKEFEKLVPYGIGNPQPKFMARGARIMSMNAMGAKGKHFAFSLEHGGVSRKAVVFEWKQPEPPLAQGVYIDAVYDLLHDTWQGRDEYKLKLVDIRVADEVR